MAAEGIKFQVNYKLNDGTLVNLYASTVSELETGLADIAMNATNIKTTGMELGGGAAAPTVASITQAFSAAPVTAGGGDTVVDKYGNTWIYNLPEAPECGRGKMVLKHGKAQATGKPYKGFFDPSAGPSWAGAKVPKESQAATIWA